MRKCIFTFGLILAISLNISNHSSLSAFNPTVAYNTFIPLNHLKNSGLQVKLNSQLNANQKYRNLIRNKKLAIGIVDLRNPEDFQFASVNGGNMMYAASLPKIAVLLAAMQAIEDGQLKETAEVKRDMFLMINKSNNAASTRMIDRVGYKKIAKVMQDPRYNLYDINNGGGLWVGKRYAARGAKNPDPIKGLSHAATVDKVCDYYYMLSQGKLVNKQRSKEMMKYLTDPGLHHKFVNTLDRVAPKAKLFRKSGSWRTYHSDSVWVSGPKRNYILVALVDDPEGEQIIRDLVNVAERALSNKSLLATK